MSGKKSGAKKSLKDLKNDGEEEESSSEEEESEEDNSCPYCSKEIVDPVKFRKHVKKCKPKESTYVHDTLDDEWYKVEGKGRTLIPPIEVNMSNDRGFACQWGCLTKTTGAAKSFRSKDTFLEHVAKDHPELRICIETPPSQAGVNGLPSKGRRLVVQESTVLVEHKF